MHLPSVGPSAVRLSAANDVEPTSAHQREAFNAHAADCVRCGV